MVKEMKIFLYSKKDGSLVKEFLASQQFEAKEEYQKLNSEGKDIGYLENPVFPDGVVVSELIWDKNLMNFRFKTAQERIDDGSLVLKPWQKIINNAVVPKKFYELYLEGLVMNTPDTVVWKVIPTGRLVRKNLLELMDINFDKRAIFDGLLIGINKALDIKKQELVKKYPRTESDLFGIKAKLAAQWTVESPADKLEFMKDPNGRAVYNPIFEEFWTTLTPEQQKDIAVLVQKMDELTAVIIENNKKYSEVIATITEERKKITSTWKGNEDKLTKQDIITLQEQYGLNADDVHLFEGYYAVLPDPSVIDPRDAQT